jgi:hypothetical protein
MLRILSVGLSIAIAVPAASAQTTAQTTATAAPAVVTRSANPTVTAGAARAAAPARTGVPVVLPGTRETAFSTIQGNALDSINGILPDSPVRLRDARLGRIISTQRTDKSGLFEFRAVDPGSYVVELIVNAETVLAASQLINVNAGETVSAVVKLPFRLPPLGGLLGHTTAQAIAITSAAAATGVLNAATTTDVSADGTN